MPLRTAQKVSATQDLFEEAEEDLDGPAVVVQQRNHFRGDIEQVGGDAERAVAPRPSAMVLFW